VDPSEPYALNPFSRPSGPRFGRTRPLASSDPRQQKYYNFIGFPVSNPMNPLQNL